MKLFAKLLLCLVIGLSITGCSSKQSTDSGSNQKNETVKKSDLEKVTESFTLSIEKTSSQSNIVKAKDDKGNQFILYIDFQGADKTIAKSMKLREHEIAFSVNNEKDSYFADSNKILLSVNEDVVSLSKKMNTLLKEKDLTLEQIRNALLEKYNKKS